MISITADGKIDDAERQRFDAIMKEFEDVVRAYYALKYARKL